jgi:Mn-dependent DtxR family transcriptional regulator
VPGRTVAEVAHAMHSSERIALLMLKQLGRDGYAEETPEGCRLTVIAERVYGEALRLMDEWLQELEAEAA